MVYGGSEWSYFSLILFCGDPQSDTGFLLKPLDDAEEVLCAGVAARSKHPMEAFARLVPCDGQFLKSNAEIKS